MVTAGRDVLRILCHDHDELRGMLDRLEAADGPSRRALLLRLRDEIQVHAQVEEELVYPAFGSMLDDEQAERSTEQRRAEHDFLRGLLNEALRVPEGSISFGEDLLLVKEAFNRHADDEEDEMFPRMSRACSEDFLVHLGRRVVQRKEVLRRQARRRRAEEARQGMSKTELLKHLRSK